MTKAKKKAKTRSGYTVFISWARIHEIVDALGKTWRFEFHAWAGPMLVDADDDILDPPLPPDDSPFWPAFKTWNDGRRAGGGR